MHGHIKITGHAQVKYVKTRSCQICYAQFYMFSFLCISSQVLIKETQFAKLETFSYAYPSHLHSYFGGITVYGIFFVKLMFRTARNSAADSNLSNK